MNSYTRLIDQQQLESVAAADEREARELVEALGKLLAESQHLNHRTQIERLASIVGECRIVWSV